MTLKPVRGRSVYIASGRRSRRTRQVIAYGGPRPLRLTLSRGSLRTFAPPFWDQLEPASRVKLRAALTVMAVTRIVEICSETVRAFRRPRLADGCLRVDDRVWLRYPCGERPDLRPVRFGVRVLGLGPPRIVELRYSPATLGRLRWLRRGALSASSERMLRRLARGSRRGSETARRARRLLKVYGAKRGIAR